jgi:hypothetical protein
MYTFTTGYPWATGPPGVAPPDRPTAAAAEGHPPDACRTTGRQHKNQARPAFEAAPALANTDLREERRIVEGGKDALADQ